VGDPNQLPPIGRGRVFADSIDWLQDANPESVGALQTNIRQMESRLAGLGTGILDLASLYVRETARLGDGGTDAGQAEEMLRRVQEGGDIDRDLRIVYWNGPDDLARLLTETLVGDIVADTGTQFDPDKPYLLWHAAFAGPAGGSDPQALQVISPYRGEQFGTDNLNLILQEFAQGKALGKSSHLDAFMLFDKVIQYRNRPKSNRIWAYNMRTRSGEQTEVYNGELGFVWPHGFDGSKWKSNRFRLKHFQVTFARKPDLRVGYGSDLGYDAQKRPCQAEAPEDNLELAYAISVHKAQGSEFGRVYFILPKHKRALLSRELFYTGITRARRHCTIFVEEDIAPLLSMRRLENSHLVDINSSLFAFRPVPPALTQRAGWYEEGKIHRTLADIMVRSKSEVIIANMLFDRDVPFAYETPLYASDGTFYLPDFTITARGEQWYWEHLGLLDDEGYRRRWEKKRAWYDRFFPGRLVTTEESGDLSQVALEVIGKLTE
jgi:hypothetical protein